MSLDTVTLQCFLCVAESGSFTRAAERVGRTQSAISQQIAKLESLLGKDLLTRGRQIALTPEGEVFLRYARQIYALQHEAMDHFKEPELEGEVRFGLPENFASTFLADILAEFARIHPRIQLRIECDLTLTLYERFRQHEFDLVLVKMHRPEDFPNGVEVWTEPLRWVGDRALIEPARPVPLVLAPQPCVYRAAALSALASAGREWRLVLTSPSYAGAVAAVKAGMGVTVMPHTMIPRELDTLDGRLLPTLADSHVSLLKHTSERAAINTLERFVLTKLKH